MDLRPIHRLAVSGSVDAVSCVTVDDLPRLAIGFHLVDYVVHGWDVARTLGNPFDPPPEVLAAALPSAFAAPDGAYRAEAKSPFGPAIPASEQSGDLDRRLAHLGRDPQWKPPAWAALG